MGRKLPVKADEPTNRKTIKVKLMRLSYGASRIITLPLGQPAGTRISGENMTFSLTLRHSNHTSGICWCVSCNGAFVTPFVPPNAASVAAGRARLILDPSGIPPPTGLASLWLRWPPMFLSQFLKLREKLLWHLVVPAFRGLKTRNIVYLEGTAVERRVNGASCGLKIGCITVMHLVCVRGLNLAGREEEEKFARIRNAEPLPVTLVGLVPINPGAEYDIRDALEG